MSDAHRTPASLRKCLRAQPPRCTCGRRHALLTKCVWVGDRLLDEAEALLPPPSSCGRILVLADPDTWDAAGGRVAARLQAGGHTVSELLTGPQPHADDETLDDLATKLSFAPGWIVAVGSGTISDLGKMLTKKVHAKQLTVGTAASMNGYTSSIAAMTFRGLKLTLPAPPPVAVLLDTAVLSAAPARLNAAGFGDLLSKPVSGADWVLSAEFFDETVCDAALSLADEAVTRCRAVAQGIGHGEPNALGVLTEALLLSGLSMSLAGASSPASGGEHLLSHYLDISTRGWSRMPHLHGEQVAVGTLVSLAIYRALREDGPAIVPAIEDTKEEAIRALHAHLDAPALKELAEQWAMKRERKPGSTTRREQVLRRGTTFWRRIDDQLRGSEETSRQLRLAGCPRSFPEIDVNVDKARKLILHARHMRDRYTVLDLAADLGRLDELADKLAKIFS